VLLSRAKTATPALCATPQAVLVASASPLRMA
jgi:hypothetical protein